MLKLKIPVTELYDEIKCEFVTSKEKVLQLEHSLVSISKWEMNWEKPFLSKKAKTEEESLDYIKCMTINANIDESTYTLLNNELMREIEAYIGSAMTATTINQQSTGKKSAEIITSELIYYWMISYTIPFECQKWHLNRLLTLVNVCNVKNAPAKKNSARETMARNRALNESRRKQLGTGG